MEDLIDSSSRFHSLDRPTVYHWYSKDQIDVYQKLRTRSNSADQQSQVAEPRGQ